MSTPLGALISGRCLPLTYPVLAVVSVCYPGYMGRLPTCYSPVRHWLAESKLSSSPFDLHVLGMPPAFILSQDQTLRLISALRFSRCFFVCYPVFLFTGWNWRLFCLVFKDRCTEVLDNNTKPLLLLSIFFSLFSDFFHFFAFILFIRRNLTSLFHVNIFWKTCIYIAILAQSVLLFSHLLHLHIDVRLIKKFILFTFIISRQFKHVL